MKTVKLRDFEYELMEDAKQCFDLEEVTEKVTDYFDHYDYILGDYSYEKLRLKGFNAKGNKNFNKINDIANLDNYLKDYCAYGAKYFLLKKRN